MSLCQRMGYTRTHIDTCYSTEINTCYTYMISGFETPTALTVNVCVFWDTSILSCSQIKVDRHFERRYRRHFQGRRQKKETCIKQVSSRAVLKAMWFSETSVDFRQAILRYVSEDSLLCDFYFF
jgi:hypothetical protein